MPLWIIVRVDQDCDYVEGVECMATFDTEEEAMDHLRGMQEECDAAWGRRCEYIEEYVDNIEMPDTDYNGWKKFLEQFHPFGIHYVMPKDFKFNLKGYLRNRGRLELEGYDPPDPPPYSRWSLFPVYVD